MASPFTKPIATDKIKDALKVPALSGIAPDSGPGVVGVGKAGDGVEGLSDSGAGVLGYSKSGPGVWAFSEHGPGVSAFSESDDGLRAETNALIGHAVAAYKHQTLPGHNAKAGATLYAESNGGTAGYFAGSVYVTGEMHVTGVISTAADVRLVGQDCA